MTFNFSNIVKKLNSKLQYSTRSSSNMLQSASGTTSIEVAIIITLVVLVAIVAIAALGDSVNEKTL